MTSWSQENDSIRISLLGNNSVNLPLIQGCQSQAAYSDSPGELFKAFQYPTPRNSDLICLGCGWILGLKKTPQVGLLSGALAPSALSYVVEPRANSPATTLFSGTCWLFLFPVCLV